jgi:hypothetical protein
LEKQELKSVANLGAYENELNVAADLTLILTSCRLLELLLREFIVIMGREQEKV